MEQLAGEVGPQGQAAVSQKGQHLAVDREAGPPQHEGGHGQPAGHCARSGEGGDPGGELQQAGDEPLSPCLIQPQGGEQSGRPAGQSAHDAGEKEHPDDNREKQHEGTDVQGGGQGPGDGVGEGHGEAGCLELGGRMSSRPGPLAGPVEAEEQAYAQGSGDMCQIEEQPRTAAGEDPGAHHPQDKGGT